MIITKEVFQKCYIIRFWRYRDLKFWPLEGDFTDAFLKVGIIIYLEEVNAQKLDLGIFLGSRNPFFDVKFAKI